MGAAVLDWAAAGARAWRAAGTQRARWLATAMLVLSCAPSTPLEPTPGAGAVQLDARSLVTRVEDVRVRVEGESWSGDPELRRVATPLRIGIENRSDAALRIQYQAVDLVALNGRNFSVLPPYNVRGPATDAVATSARGAVTNPGFDYEGFEVAFYAAVLYPTLMPHTGVFPVEPRYFVAAGEQWEGTPFPNRAVLRQALPEGVLRPGGQLSGFIFFEPIPNGIDGVVLGIGLVDAATSRRFGVAMFPFAVGW